VPSFNCKNPGNRTPKLLASWRYTCYLLQARCADILWVKQRFYQPLGVWIKFY